MIVDQNLEGVAEKLSLPCPLEFQNKIGVAGFIFEWKFTFFEYLQMIVKPYFDDFAGKEFGKRWSSPLSRGKGVYG